MKNTIKYDTPDFRDIVIGRYRLKFIARPKPSGVAENIPEDSKPEEEKKDETKKEGEKVKKDETKSEEKKDDVKKEEEKKEDDIVEIIDEEKKVTEEPQEYDYVERLGRFVKFITWDHTDAPYYLKEVRGKKVLSTEDQNEAMTKMLESFVVNDGKSPAKKDETKSEEKKDDVKKEEEKKEDDIVEIIDEEKKVTEEPQEYDYVERLGRFVKFITWDHTDAPYYLKEVRGKKVLSTEDQNEAMTKMLESFVANDGKSPAQQQSSIFILYLL